MLLSTVAGAAVVPAKTWLAGVPIGEALSRETAPASEAVEVYVNEGRWIAECPDCGGAQITSPADRRFMCNECANVVAGGLWRPVVWPSQAATIDQLLALRPRRHAHWLPGETVADLQDENRAQGVS